MCPFSCSGVQGVQGVFGVFSVWSVQGVYLELGVWGLGFRVDDIWQGQRGDRGGGPKMAKFSGGVKFQHFGPPLWPKKCI